jgi:lipoate-protein ligase A
MAADEVLLESAMAGVASLRFYEWSEATLSLGYFQPERLRRSDPRLANLPFVRRPTGGEAIVHDQELTYALGLPADSPWQTARACSWLSLMHEIIGKILAEQGISASIASHHQKPPPEGILCFQHLTPGDLLIGRSKVVGSAQRRRRGVLLQHGSILLAASPHAPNLPGLQQLTGRRLLIPRIRSAIESEFARQTGWQLMAGEWPAVDRQRIEKLAAEKYRSPTWNLKR